ncbi:hypothetical protein L873DRAFT_883898 [Choiromyces venosus 120613-1]|uniref:Uncharacterized protein n=1 Tax=Choiromyces venosus 120613-1 TaxID=1336337 RepID=A0A3N4JNG5_9PEZI|nr:hypothetical protein L873DRAFT_883898 [Choiromyces venosus 120613-1]
MHLHPQERKKEKKEKKNPPTDGIRPAGYYTTERKRKEKKPKTKNQNKPKYSTVPHCTIHHHPLPPAARGGYFPVYRLRTRLPILALPETKGGVFALTMQVTLAVAGLLFFLLFCIWSSLGMFFRNIGWWAGKRNSVWKRWVVYSWRLTVTGGWALGGGCGYGLFHTLGEGRGASKLFVALLLLVEFGGFGGKGGGGVFFFTF